MHNHSKDKNSLSDFALLGGNPTFSSVRSASNLVAPDKEAFFNYAQKIYKNKWITNNGPLVTTLECRLADLHKTKHVICFCSGFMALQVCMHALALSGKKEIIMPSLTYRRMADVAAWAGLIPRFCDVDPHTRAISAKTAEVCINDNTALILGVHPIVSLCDIDGLKGLATKYGIPLLFDSVEAGYASFNGKMLGSFGEAEVFSMHASKLINSFEGGYVTTNNSDLTEKLSCIRGFGFKGRDEVCELGLNAKLNELHAAVALCSMDDLESQIWRNKKRHNAYIDELKDIPGLNLIRYNESEKRSFKNNIVKLNSSWPLSRALTISLLHAEGMLVRPYYSPPLHEKHKDISLDCLGLPVTKSLSRQFMLLPSGDRVNINDVKTIVKLLRFIQTNGSEIQEYFRKNEGL